MLYPFCIKAIGDRYTRKYPSGIKTPPVVKWLPSEPYSRMQAAIAKILCACVRLVMDTKESIHRLLTPPTPVKWLASAVVAKILHVRVRLCTDDESH